MKPSINLDKKDPKICLLTKILKYFDDETIKQTLARNNVHNINQMIDCIKIILMTMYYDYTISYIFCHLQHSKRTMALFHVEITPLFC